MTLVGTPRLLTTVAGLLLYLQSSAVSASLVDFEGWADGVVLTSQVPGLVFQNGIILSAGVSLNEFEFPPRSGANVVSDNGGPMTIVFATPVLSVSGYFTYTTPLTLQAFSPDNAPLGSTASTFNSNMALSGDPGSSLNELVMISHPSGIGSVTIIGDPAGSSFVLDDLVYTPANQPVPEPGSLVSFLTGAAIMSLLRRRKTT